MIAADSWRLIGDVHPSEQALILRRGRDRIESSFCNWGYPAKEQGGLVINARAETLLEKPLFCEDTLHRHGLKTVMVTGGLATVETCERLRGKIDAMNIDLKAFSDRFYKELIGGDHRMVMDFIECAHSFAHIELTCLLIPGENDDPEEMDAFHRISSLILVDRNTHKYIRGRRKAIICGFYDCRDRTDMLK